MMQCPFLCRCPSASLVAVVLLLLLLLLLLLAWLHPGGANTSQAEPLDAQQPEPSTWYGQVQPVDRTTV